METFSHTNGTQNGASTTPHQIQPLTIRLPTPIVYKSDTPERIQALINLIKSVQTPYHILVMATIPFVRALIELLSPHQRRTSERTKNQLLSDYQNANYLHTGDPIRFEASGAWNDGHHLGIDGQHRLYGQEEAGVEVLQVLYIGLDRKVKEVIDSGRPRTVPDAIRLRDGSTTRTRPTALMTGAINLEAGKFDKKVTGDLSRQERIAASDALSDLDMEVLSQISLATKPDIRTTGVLAGALRAYKQYPDLQVVDFLCASLGNQATNPSHIPQLSGELYNYLNKAGTKGASQAAVHNQACAIIKTVHRLFEGGDVRLRAATPAEIEKLASY